MNRFFPIVQLTSLILSSAVAMRCQPSDSSAADTLTLAAPSELTATAGSPSHFDLTWVDNANDETGFFIERKTADGSWQRIGKVPANTITFQSGGAEQRTTYAHRVNAYQDQGQSDYSNSVSATTPARADTLGGTIIENSAERQGEGSFARLADGRLLLYYNYYPGVSGDEQRSEIYEKTSTDNGNTWSVSTLAFEAERENHSLLHPSLLRLDDGTLLLSYVRMGNLLGPDGHHPEPGGAWARRVVRKSTDEAQTWSEEVAMTDSLIPFEGRHLRYLSGSHDRMIQLSNGRLVYPVLGKDSEETPKTLYTVVYTSDDQGNTWQLRNEPFVLRESIEIRENLGFNEPSVVEYAPGELLMYMRAYTGWFYESRSTDYGTTWSAPVRSSVRASASPPKLFALPDTDFIGLLYNSYVDSTQMNLGYRRILASMISEDGGLTWTNYQEIEYGDPQQEETYDYPALHFDQSDVHLVYMQGHPYVPRYIVYRQLPVDWFVRDANAD